MQGKQCCNSKHIDSLQSKVIHANSETTDLSTHSSNTYHQRSNIAAHPTDVRIEPSSIWDPLPLHSSNDVYRGGISSKDYSSLANYLGTLLSSPKKDSNKEMKNCLFSSSLVCPKTSLCIPKFIEKDHNEKENFYPIVTHSDSTSDQNLPQSNEKNSTFFSQRSKKEHQENIHTNDPHRHSTTDHSPSKYGEGWLQGPDDETTFYCNKTAL